jgi:hypothetical protein
MLQDERVMNIIITAFIGKQQLSKWFSLANWKKKDEDAENVYVCTPCEWIDGRQADALYTPTVSPKDTLPSVVVKVQHMVNSPFIRRLIKYCGHITDKYRVEPVALTIGISRVRNEVTNMLSDTAKASFFTMTAIETRKFTT